MNTVREGNKDTVRTADVRACHDEGRCGAEEFGSKSVEAIVN